LPIESLPSVTWTQRFAGFFRKPGVRLTKFHKTKQSGVHRHVSHETIAEFADFLKWRRPTRIDVGCVQTIRPSIEKFYPAGCRTVARKELTFDIDIDAYDQIRAPGRTCCSGRDTCSACWPLVTIGCELLAKGLQIYGSTKFYWYYSGGRGMHCWVEDVDTPNTSARISIATRLVGRKDDAATLFDAYLVTADPIADAYVKYLTGSTKVRFARL
jgi:hypothetical protein